MRRFVCVAALLGLPRVAVAHAILPGTSDFYAGVCELTTGPADVLVWLALAGLAGLQAQRSAGWVAETFALGLTVGLLSARWLRAEAPPELADPPILLLSGGLIAAGRGLRGKTLHGFAVLVGIVRGWHYGADTLTREDLPALAGGLVLAGYLLVACSLAVVLCLVGSETGMTHRGWRRVSLRALGSWVAAIAILWGVASTRAWR
jgi:hypothetical protein